MLLRLGVFAVVSGVFVQIAGCGGGDDNLDVESKTSALLTDPALVKPVLECVTQEDATHYTAYFGYSNTAAEDVSVPVGSSNKFTPGTNLGQPTLFIPGRQRSVFSVPFNGSNLVWKLGPRTSTASSSSKRCVFPDAGVDAAIDATADAPPNPCSNPIGLDDANPCTTDSCDPVLGVQHQPVGNGVLCSNGNSCDGVEMCFSGTCTPGTPPGLDDGNPCTVDACDPATGPIHSPVANGSLCLNASLCDGPEACLDGACTAGTPPVVDDGNPCTVDICDPVLGISHDPVGDLTGCPNATLCDGVETCIAGICQSGTPPVVDDGNPCTIDSCDAMLGVAHTPAPDGTSCTDGDACTLSDTCQGGTCSASQSVSCGLPPGCTTPGVCDPSTGVCSAASGCVVCGNGSLDQGEQCDDGNVVSGDGCSATCEVERCNGVVCPTSTDPCMENACSPTTGQCVLSPKANGVTCSDNRLCTTNDQCQDGACVGTAVVCGTGGGNGADCGTATFCQETTGLCVTGPAPNDTPCNDGNSCTTGDVCLAGACTGAVSTACFNQTVTPIDPTVPTLLGPSTAFIYSGPDAVQQGMSSHTIDFRIASVLRGRVRTRFGVPIGAVNVSVLGHPEFGTTRSREDGYFDMVVNGGVEHLLRFERPGFLRVDRPMKTYWGEYSVLPDVVLTEFDNRMTPVGFPTTVPTVVSGNPVTDEDGTRTISLFFNPGTFATIGGANVPLLSIRATEFTVGPDGPNAMPMPLPENSAYTFAFALTADEVNEDTTINFSQPAALYVENFLQFPNGIPLAMGVGYPAKGAWCADPNGRVVTVVGVQSGRAILDPEVPATTEELQFVASRYQVGQSLWRIPIGHFTVFDANPPFGARKGTTTPAVDPPRKKNENKRSPKNDETDCGSVIGCESRTLGEEMAITGTPFSLTYATSNAPGDIRSRQFGITAKPLRDGDERTAEATPENTVVEAIVAGQVIRREVPPAAFDRDNPVFDDFEWDGLDAYGRKAQGAQPARVRVGYTYSIIYRTPEERNDVFAQWSIGDGNASLVRDAAKIVLWSEPRNPSGASWTLGEFQAPRDDLAGWKLDVHHTYDPAARIVHKGNGMTLAGTDVRSLIYTYVRLPADGQAARRGVGLQTMPNGDLVIKSASTSTGIRTHHRLDPDGVMHSTFSGSQPLQYPEFFKADGTFYRTSVDDFLRRFELYHVSSTTFLQVEPVRIFLNTQIDNVNRELNPGRATVQDDNTIYFLGTTTGTSVARLQKMTPCNGMQPIGSGMLGTSPDETLAGLAAYSGINNLVSGPDGNLYFSESSGGNTNIRYIDAGGEFHTAASVVGNAAFKFSPSGQMFIINNGNRLLKLDTDGALKTVAGNGTILSETSPTNRSLLARGLPATSAIPAILDIGFPPDGSIIAMSAETGVAAGYLYKITNPMPGYTGNTTVIADGEEGASHIFDANGRHVRTVDLLTQATVHEFSYTPDGKLSGITDRDGLTTTIVRDATGSPTSIIAPGGQTTSLTRNASGVLDSIADPLGNTWSFTFDANGLLTSARDPNGHQSTMQYDSSGALLRDTNAAGGFWDFTQSGSGMSFVVEKTSAEGRRTTFDVTLPDEYGIFRETITGPTGNVAVITVDQAGRKVTTKDGITTTTELGPDPRFGFQVPFEKSQTIAFPSGLQRTVTQTRAVTTNATTGALITQTVNSTVNGRIFQSIYNATTRTTTTTSPENRTTTTVVDAVGRPVIRQVGTLEETQYVYDTRGRITLVTMGSDPTARSVAFEYDAKDRVVAVTDPLGRIHSISHDDADRPTAGTSPALNMVSFGYDPTGNVLAISPPGRPAHLSTFSPVNLPTTYSPPAAGPGAWSTNWGYNLDKQVVSMTRPDGITVANSYDLGGRLTQIAHSGGFRTFEYNGSQRILIRSASEDGVTTAFTHDGNLPLSTTWSGPVAGSVQRQFDANLRVTRETVNGAHPVALGYDRDGLILSINDLNWTRDGNGMVVSGYAGYLREETGYNSFGERESDLQRSVIFPAATYLANVYTRDALGRITRKEETVLGEQRVLEYEYDPDGRLERVITDGVATAVYTYDANGNRLSVARPSGTESGTYDAQDRLLTYGSLQYEYTRNGELSTKTDTTNGEVTRYQYDVHGELKRVELPDGRVVEYLTDASDRRVGKKVNGVLVKGWLYSGALTPAAELDGAGNVVSRIVAGEMLVRDGVTYRLVKDHLGSVRFVVNISNGATAQQLDYDEFGRVTLDTNPGFQPFGYAGGVYDAETGLVRFGARDYDAGAGRWTAKDPIGFSGGYNLYGYAKQDPISNVDSFGESPVPGELLLRYGLDHYEEAHLSRNLQNRCPFRPPSVTECSKDGRKWEKTGDKFRGSDGSECVYHPDGTPKTDEGSFNFGKDPTNPWTTEHAMKDVLPYLIWGPETKGLTTYVAE